MSSGSRGRATAAVARGRRSQARRDGDGRAHGGGGRGGVVVRQVEEWSAAVVAGGRPKRAHAPRPSDDAGDSCTTNLCPASPSNTLLQHQPSPLAAVPMPLVCAHRSTCLRQASTAQVEVLQQGTGSSHCRRPCSYASEYTSRRLRFPTRRRRCLWRRRVLQQACWAQLSVLYGKRSMSTRLLSDVQVGHAARSVVTLHPIHGSP